MISYAQNGEDVVLARAFAGQTDGFYVDVGAWDPDEDSVTRHFYDLGWRGINIEPVPAYHQKLAQRRPRDQNLAVAVGSARGQAKLFVFPDTGLSTLDPEVARSHAQSWEEITVEVVPFADSVPHDARIDFLKIDVEGAEKDVLESLLRSPLRPRVLVVEATYPKTQRQVHAEWEPLVLGAGYAFALFDGLNRFYAREPELRERMSYPACSFDRYRSARLQQLIDENIEIHARATALETQVDALKLQISQLQMELMTRGG